MFKPILQPRSCLQCSKMFHPRRARSLYCSKVCYWQSRIGRRGPYLPPFARLCVACGTPFTTPRTGGYRKQRMCSIECQRAARYRRGAKAKHLRPTDAAWLAGFLDGEGSIMLHGRKSSVLLRVTASNTHRATLDHICTLCGVGANIWHASKETAAWKPSGDWVANGEAAESVLRQTLPYMITRCLQAELAIAFQERLRTPALKADRTWQVEWMTKMKRLNQRGPTI